MFKIFFRSFWIFFLSTHQQWAIISSINCVGLFSLPSPRSFFLLTFSFSSAPNSCLHRKSSLQRHWGRLEANLRAFWRDRSDQHPHRSWFEHALKTYFFFDKHLWCLLSSQKLVVPKDSDSSNLNRLNPRRSAYLSSMEWSLLVARYVSMMTSTWPLFLRVLSPSFSLFSVEALVVYSWYSQLKVGLADNPGGGATTTSHSELDDDESGGMALSAHARAILMAKLGRTNEVCVSLCDVCFVLFFVFVVPLYIWSLIYILVIFFF